MKANIATHSGPFHADDVMAVALLLTFWDADADVVRTRDAAIIKRATAVVDVGGIHDPDTLRFDHHQSSYTGPRSAAGMVLDWLELTDRMATGLAESFRVGVMTYLDEVDNGRRHPASDVLCFPRIVEALCHPADTLEAFDEAFGGAVSFARAFLEGHREGYRRVEVARGEVVEAMRDAVSNSCNVLFFDRYLKWKKPYFEEGGSEHPTEFVVFPGAEGTWRIVAIPTRLGVFDQKRSLPEAWAGLTDDDLARVTGIEGSVFCHKNRFIAVFKTREDTLKALKMSGLLHRD